MKIDKSERLKALEELARQVPHQLWVKFDSFKNFSLEEIKKLIEKDE